MTITKRRCFGLALYYISSYIVGGVVVASVMDTDYNVGILELNRMVAELYA